MIRVVLIISVLFVVLAGCIDLNDASSQLLPVGTSFVVQGTATTIDNDGPCLVWIGENGVTYHLFQDAQLDNDLFDLITTPGVTSRLEVATRSDLDVACQVGCHRRGHRRVAGCRIKAVGESVLREYTDAFIHCVDRWRRVVWVASLVPKTVPAGGVPDVEPVIILDTEMLSGPAVGIAHNRIPDLVFDIDPDDSSTDEAVAFYLTVAVSNSDAVKLRILNNDTGLTAGLNCVELPSDRTILNQEGPIVLPDDWQVLLHGGTGSFLAGGFGGSRQTSNWCRVAAICYGDAQYAGGLCD